MSQSESTNADAGKRTVLVVGCGSIGRRHIRLLSERPDTRVLACDHDPAILADALRETPVEQSFDDLDAALAAAPEFVWVCTPDPAHEAVATPALRAGAHVFCEKPLAHTVESGRAIATVAQETGRTVGVGYIMRCENGCRRIKQLLDDGELGTVVAARVKVGAYDTLLNMKSGFITDRKDSIVLDYSHELDYLLWFMGPVAEVMATATSIGDLPLKPDPNVVAATLRFESGTVVSLHLDYVQLPGGRMIELFGDAGNLSYTMPRGKILLQAHGADAVTEIPIAGERDDWFRKEHQSFFDAVAAGQQPLVSAEDGVATLRVAEAIITANRKNHVVHLS